jgi:DNA-binding MarR family transcriptional regulator
MANQFITVSIEIMHDKNLTPNQKFILAEIEQLSTLENGCIASNKHFSDLIGITTQGVSKAINQLSKDGYITIDNAQTKRNFGRVITINYRKSAINYRKSAINYSLESKDNKTINKTINIENDADYIYEHYKNNIKSSTNKQQGINNIMKWLKEFSKDELLKSINNYSIRAKQQTEAKYIKDCKNFFGVKGESAAYFKDFILCDDVEPALPNGNPIPSYMK